MIQIPKLNIDPAWEILIRRKWYIASCVVLSLLCGAGYLMVTKKVYKASTLILVEPQSIPDAYVKSTVTATIERGLRTLGEQVHSRTNLEKIIHEFKLMDEYVKQRQSTSQLIGRIFGFLGLSTLSARFTASQADDQVNDRIMTMQLVEDLRRDIWVAMHGVGKDRAFEISFSWHDPDIAAQVANTLAARFIQESLAMREEAAIATTQFLELEAERIRSELEARETELEAFKRQHIGMLPMELPSNIQLINQMKEDLGNLEKKLDTEKQMAISLESQIQIQKSLMSTINTDSSTSADSAVVEEPGSSAELLRLESELATARLRYKERHPDVQALVRQIEAAKMEKRVSSPGSGVESSQIFMEAMPDSLSPQLQMMRNQIASYEKQIDETRKKLELYKNRVESTSQVEIEMTKILRDYETVRLRYQNLLSKKLDAKMAEELEKRQKAEQFRVIDPAVKPEKPFKPNNIKVMLLAFLAGICLGGGVALFQEAMDPCFYSKEDLESFLGTNVILSLPSLDGELVAPKTS